MLFSEKIDLLFDISKAEAKELASALNFSPSLISKMRKGTRKRSKDQRELQLISDFFAYRCGSSEQRDALANALYIDQIRVITDVTILSHILADWLSDEQDPKDYAASRAQDFLKLFNRLPQELGSETPPEEVRKVLTDGSSSFFVYYGEDGRRMAALVFYQYLLQLKGQYQIDLLTDEDVGWISENARYLEQYRTNISRLSKNGCTFRRISGPILDVNQAFDSLNRWMPLYMNGKATSYHFKRLRDSLNRVTIFVVPEVAAMFSFSVAGMARADEITFFTVDTRTVGAMEARFERYFEQCEPILRAYCAADTAKELNACMLRYESCQASCIQRSNSLSMVTLPWDVAMAMEAGENQEGKNLFLINLASRYKVFTRNLSQYAFTDIIRVADIDDIMAGRVPVSASCLLGWKPRFYRPMEYLQHLRQIIYLLEHEPNYHVVERDGADTEKNILYVKDGLCVILARDVYPFSAFELTERHLMDAFSEFLQRQLPADCGSKQYKRTVVSKLRMLAAELSRRISDGQRTASAK